MKQCLATLPNTHEDFVDKIRINITNPGKILDVNKSVVRSRRDIKKRFKLSSQ